jgi:hypothetical protein
MTKLGYCPECHNRGQDPNHWGGDCPLRKPPPQTQVLAPVKSKEIVKSKIVKSRAVKSTESVKSKAMSNSERQMKWQAEHRDEYNKRRRERYRKRVEP